MRCYKAMFLDLLYYGKKLQKKNGNHRAKGYLLVTIGEAIDRQASAE